MVKRKVDKVVLISIVFAVSVVVLCIVFLTLFLTTGKRTTYRTKQALPLSLPLLKEYNTSPFPVTEQDRLNIENKYSDSDEIWNSTIVVSISSYRDTELCLTLKDCFEKAANKNRISFIVVEQNEPTDPFTTHANNFAKTFELDGTDRFIVETLSWREAKGPTWARHLAHKHIGNQKYHLLTDSHMRFEYGWDCYFIDQILQTENPSKSILSFYPAAYLVEKIDTEPNNFKYTVHHRKLARHFKPRECFNGIVYFWSQTVLKKLFKPKENFAWGACFSFCQTSIVKAIPYQDNTPFLFIGEEQYMLARFFTHGYKIYLPTESWIYHCWSRGYRPLYWKDMTIPAEKINSEIKITQIFKGIATDEKYPMGKEKSLQELWQKMKVSECIYKHKRMVFS